jgi:hypothetical protein
MIDTVSPVVTKWFQNKIVNLPIPRFIKGKLLRSRIDAQDSNSLLRTQFNSALEMFTKFFNIPTTVDYDLMHCYKVIHGYQIEHIRHVVEIINAYGFRIDIVQVGESYKVQMIPGHTMAEYLSTKIFDPKNADHVSFSKYIKLISPETK